MIKKKKTKKVLIDARLPEYFVGGIQVVLQCLGSGFKKYDDEDIELIWLVYKNTKWWITFFPKNGQIVEVTAPLGSFGLYLLKKFPRVISKLRPIYTKISKSKFPYDSLLKNLDVDLVHQPFQDSFETNYPTIWHPHDLQHEHFPRFFTKLQRQHRNTVWRNFALKSDVIVVESPLIKDDLEKFWNVDTDKCVMIPTPPLIREDNSALPSSDVLNATNSGLYIFYPAVFWPHKNHIRLISAVEKVRKYGLNINLILSGAKTGDYKKIKKHALQSQISKNIFFVGHVSNDDLVYLYKNCTLVAIPTLHESLSLPIWESWSYSKPLAYSNIGFLPSQVGEGGIPFNPYDSDSIAKSLITLLEMPEQDKRKLQDWANQKLKFLTLDNFVKSMCVQYRTRLELDIPNELLSAHEELLTGIGLTQ